MIPEIPHDINHIRVTFYITQNEYRVIMWHKPAIVDLAESDVFYHATSDKFFSVWQQIQLYFDLEECLTFTFTVSFTFKRKGSAA